MHHEINALLQIDDLILTASDPKHIEQLNKALQLEFSLKDLGQLDYFLSIEATHVPSSVILTQRKYMNDLLAKANMQTCNGLATLATPQEKLSLSVVDEPISAATLYRTIVGGLQYLNLTRPNVAYSVTKYLNLFTLPPLGIGMQSNEF
ncbi:hypothetical protein GH714_010394 [Hevea brasiliensis]|uniref:Reverse transcriptase Ty1/copia-type domain-containing protein n=1 Tax=Hevea brasiliensis TaxID=3981 RepID=A0A6A6KCG0_HEVBR|nr:hypothetical protein GH714_010394 [Hevea brasiliensis]